MKLSPLFSNFNYQIKTNIQNVQTKLKPLEYDSVSFSGKAEQNEKPRRLSDPEKVKILLSECTDDESRKEFLTRRTKDGYLAINYCYGQKDKMELLEASPDDETIKEQLEAIGYNLSAKNIFRCFDKMKNASTIKEILLVPSRTDNCYYLFYTLNDIYWSSKDFSHVEEQKKFSSIINRVVDDETTTKDEAIALINRLKFYVTEEDRNELLQKKQRLLEE